jgi:hypothetical protein
MLKEPTFAQNVVTNTKTTHLESDGKPLCMMSVAAWADYRELVEKHKT